MKKYFKPILGSFLIVMALSLLTFWEVTGREMVLMENILVAQEDIYPGTVVTAGMFKEASILSENRIEKGMTLPDVSTLNGKVSEQLILKNSQISKEYFSERKSAIREGSGIYQIKPEWIFSVSSSIRKNDVADVYSVDGQTKMGSFPVAFVKDGQGKEVVDEITQNRGREIIERSEGSAVVSEVEIISTMEQYKIILDYIVLNEGKLILINRKE